MKTLLYIVDVQNDFMLPNGKLYVKNAEKKIENIKKAIQWAKDNDIQIVYSADYHFKDSKELSATPDFVNTFPEHCMASGDGWKLVDGVYPKDAITLTWTDVYEEYELNDLASKMDGVIILKDQFDVFTGNKNTDKFIDKINPDVVYIAGVVESVCVNQAVQGFLKRDCSVIAIEDAIENLEHIPSCKEQWKTQGVSLISVSDLKFFSNEVN